MILQVSQCVPSHGTFTCVPSHGRWLFKMPLKFKEPFNYFQQKLDLR